MAKTRRQAAAAPPPLSGNLDGVRPDGSVTGWCWSAAEPALRREVSVLIDDAEAARALCDQPRPDLLAAGVGDGAHGMKLLLPAPVRQAGRSVRVSLRDVASGRPIGAAVAVTWAAQEADTPPHVLRGNLDRVSRDGWVSGWCWYPDKPDAPVDLTILVDETAVGSARAADFRADLKEAGIGDGSHGFAFALPWAALDGKGLLNITVRETTTGAVLGEPILMRAGRAAAAEDRIGELERELRLLRAQLDELGRRDRVRDEDRAARELFATVAGFFAALAEGDAGAPLGGALKAAVEDVTARFAPLVLAIPEAPSATICVGAGAPLETIYRCLAALHEAGADDQADIVLLDDASRGSEAALLPAVVRNLRYLRLPGGMAARNEAARTARGSLVAWLAPQIRVMPGWLEAIAATFAADPAAAAVGSKVVREDGLLHHTGIVLEADGMLRDPGRLAAADGPEGAVPRAVHGFGDVAFALKRDMMAAAGGFGAGYSGPTHAVFDLCMRLRGQGWGVLYQPAAVALWSDEGTPAPAPVPDLSLPDEDSRLLRQRWAANPD